MKLIIYVINYIKMQNKENLKNLIQKVIIY